MRPALLVLALTGCASTCPIPEPEIRTIEVKVPVEVARTADPALAECRQGLPVPTFVERTALIGIGPETEWVLVLPPDQIAPFAGMVGGLVRCLDAWESWAAP